MQRKLSMLVLAFVLVGVFSFIPTHVFAHPAVSLVPLTSCHGLSCDGKDPDATGCNIGASEENNGMLSNNAGEIYLFYSHPCNAWFGAVESNFGNAPIYMDIYLGNGARGHTRTTKNDPDVSSYMIYDGDYQVTIYFFVEVNNNPSDTGLLTSP